MPRYKDVDNTQSSDTIKTDRAKQNKKVKKRRRPGKTARVTPTDEAFKPLTIEDPEEESKTRPPSSMLVTPDVITSPTFQRLKAERIEKPRILTPNTEEPREQTPSSFKPKSSSSSKPRKRVRPSSPKSHDILENIRKIRAARNEQEASKNEDVPAKPSLKPKKPKTPKNVQGREDGPERLQRDREEVKTPSLKK